MIGELAVTLFVHNVFIEFPDASLAQNEITVCSSEDEESDDSNESCKDVNSVFGASDSDVERPKRSIPVDILSSMASFCRYSVDTFCHIFGPSYFLTLCRIGRVFPSNVAQIATGLILAATFCHNN